MIRKVRGRTILIRHEMIGLPGYGLYHLVQNEFERFSFAARHDGSYFNRNGRYWAVQGYNETFPTLKAAVSFVVGKLIEFEKQMKKGKRKS